LEQIPFMEYRVQGLDEATGEQREIVVDADSAGEAMALARQEGLRAKSVAGVDETTKFHRRSSKGSERKQGSQTRPYPGLKRLASWYRFTAGVMVAVTLIGALVGVGATADNPVVGLLMLTTFSAAGLIGIISLLALAEGIEMAMDVAADLRDIRDRLSDT
jgi:hypothetical protein